MNVKDKISRLELALFKEKKQHELTRIKLSNWKEYVRNRDNPVIVSMTTDAFNPKPKE